MSKAVALPPYVRSSSGSRRRHAKGRGKSPASALGPHASVVQSVENETRLPLVVREAVIPVALAELLLEPRVRGPGLWIGAKVIAKEQMLALPLAAGRADVDLDRAGRVSGWAEVPVLRLPEAERDAELFDSGHVRGFLLHVPDAHLDVDDRLGGKPVHRGRTNVLDPHGRLSERGVETLPPLAERGDPRIPIGDHLDRVGYGSPGRGRELQARVLDREHVT